MGVLTVRACRTGWCNGDDGLTKVCGLDRWFERGRGLIWCWCFEKVRFFQKKKGIVEMGKI